MAHDLHVEELPTRRLEGFPRAAGLVVAALVLLGLVALITTLIGNSERAWRAYLFNWLFFTSIAQGAVILAAAVTITRGIWARPVRRLALSFVTFLPLAWVLLVPLLMAGEHVFPWVEHPVAGKEAWLNLPFLAVRNLIFFGVLVGVSLLFAYWALRPDAELMREAGVRRDGLQAWLGRRWRGQEEEERRAHGKLTTLAVVLALIYAVAFSFIAWDLVMSLEPHWWSTLIGPFFFMGAFVGGVAATAILAVSFRESLGLQDFIGTQQLHDLGKLIFGFSIFWAYLFWSQFLVIWYGLLPIEQVYVNHRLGMPYQPIAFLVFLFVFVFPFFGLLGVKPKTTPGILATFAGVLLFGLWLERYILVYPAYYHELQDVVFGLPEVGIALLFAGLLAGSVLLFATRFSIFQIWQPPSTLDLPEFGSPMAPHEQVTE